MLESFRKAPPARQLLLAVIAAIVLCTILASAWFFVLRTPYGLLFNNLRVTDSAAIAAELDRKKIPYRLQDGGTTIFVPADRVDSTRLAVSGDLPLKGQVGFELFNNSDMGITDFAQKVNYQRALQGELARTIQSMDSVESARVHLWMSDRSTFRDDRVPSKASVALIARAGHRITAQAVEGIQRLVAAAVPDLDPGNVVVIDDGGRVIASDDLATPVSNEAPERRNAEQRYASDITRALAGIAPGQPHVSVWAGPSREAPGAAGEAGFYADPEARRDFPLHIVITPSTPVSGTVASELRSSALAAIAPAVPGDGVYVGASPATAADPALDMPLASAAPRAPALPTPVRDFSAVALWAGLAAALAVLIAVVVPRRFRRRVLSDAERQDFVVRFQSLLEGRQADG